MTHQADAVIAVRERNVGMARASDAAGRDDRQPGGMHGLERCTAPRPEPGPVGHQPGDLAQALETVGGRRCSRIGTPLPASSPITSGGRLRHRDHQEARRGRGEQVAVRSERGDAPFALERGPLGGVADDGADGTKASGRALVTRRKKAPRQPVPTSAKSHAAIERSSKACVRRGRRPRPNRAGPADQSCRGVAAAVESGSLISRPCRADR